MRGLELTPQRVVVLYFSGCAVLWAGRLVITWAQTPAEPAVSLQAVGTERATRVVFAALMLHAMTVDAAASFLRRWFFGHGPLAVILCALPLLFVATAFWIVPALLYVIGTAYVWEASRRERPGQLQAPPRT